MWQLIALCTLFSLTKSQSDERLNILTNTLLQELMNRMANSETIDDLNESPYEMVNPIRVTPDYELHPYRYQGRDDLVLPPEQSAHKDYFEPISLWGPQYIQRAVPDTIQPQPPAKFLQKKLNYQFDFLRNLRPEPIQSMTRPVHDKELIEVKRAKPQPKAATSDVLTAQLDNLKQQTKQNTDPNIGKEKI